MIKKSAYLGVILLFLFGVISCEKDFTDIGSSVINNNVFETKDTVLDIFITQEDINSVRADGGIINSDLGEYLLGVYKSPTGDLRTVKASIISQVGYLPNLKVVDQTFVSDTTIETTMDKVLIRMPYQSTNTGTTNGIRNYRIDSILGIAATPTPVKVYRNTTFLNSLNVNDPTQSNSYNSDETYNIDSGLGVLNEDPDFKYTVPQRFATVDTMFVFDRNLSNGNTFKDTIKITNSAPFFTIPLDQNKVKSLFLDEYEGSNFANQAAFENYMRGFIIEASGSEGSMIPFNFSSGAPTLEIYYTNTVLANGVVIDTITKNNSFPLNGIRNSIYDSSTSNPVIPGSFTVQGTTGTMGNIEILQGSQLQDLSTRDWLINDASLVFYIEKNRDTINVPLRLFLYKNEPGNPSQIKDMLTEGATAFGGQLLLDDNGSKDRYHIRITDYISDLLSGESTYNPQLGLKIYNPTNLPTFSTDTIISSYNWNPRGVVLHSNTSSNTTRKAQLKISYSVKK